MLPRINPISTTAWQQLIQHTAEMRGVHMRKLFRNDKDRFTKFSLCLDEIVFDYSKNIITEKTIRLLLQLANECKLKEATEAMFNGELINETEHRSVLHTALRNFSGEPVFSEGQNIMPGIKKVLRKMKTFCQAIHSGK